jgi:hypothetical protein
MGSHPPGAARREFYAEKAKEAAEKATECRDYSARGAWEFIAKSWDLLASLDFEPRGGVSHLSE